MRHFSFILLLSFVAATTPAQQASTPPTGPTFARSNPSGSQDAQSAGKAQALPCPPKVERQAGQPAINKVESGILAPKPIHMAEAEFSKDARKMIRKQHLKDFQAISLLSMVVDAQGNPQDICVQKFAGFGLDENAVKAAGQYRFQPATKPDGTPVAVQINVEVNFRLY